MDQAKIGNFLKMLRKQKGLTQEQLAEHFNVNRRTVSRWETGSNLPDLDILIELSNYYSIDLQEILYGERTSEKNHQELEETVLQIAEYSNEDKLKITKRMHFLYIGGCSAAILYMILLCTGHADNFLGGLCFGITFGMTIVGAIMTSKYAAKIRNYKMRLLKRQS